MRIAVAGGTGMVGRYVVEAARAGGHETVVLSRSEGVDLRRDEGLAEALAGVDVVVDAANSGTINRAKATEFFTDVTARLLRVGSAQGVSRLVTLSIVGIDRVPGYGYYQAKVAQEEAARRGPLPVTIVRATQFHEFPAQIMTRTKKGPFVVMPIMAIQPVAAQSVGQVLVEVAVSDPTEDLLEVAGPAQENLVDMARATLRHQHQRAVVIPVPLRGAAGKAMRSGGQRPLSGARLIGPRFSDWLATADAGVVTTS